MGEIRIERPVAPSIHGSGFHSNPYPYYQTLHDTGPIHWSDDFFGGAWLLTRHADVEMVLRDPRFSAQRTGAWVNGRESARGEFAEFQRLFARALLFTDTPEHPRIRRVLQLGFKSEALHRLRPHIGRAVDELLDKVPDDCEFDFIETVARPLPARVIALLLGIDDMNHEDFLVWSEDLASFIGAERPSHEQVRRAQRSLSAMGLYFENLLEKKRNHPKDDLVSHLLQAEEGGEIHGGSELLAQCTMLLFAGYETTRHLLGNGVHALLSHPEQWYLLQAQPALITGAVREILRYESPVQYTGRRITTNLNLHGHQLKRGDLVLPMIGAANRDPNRYKQPNRLDITRCEGNALSFGSGPHVCIGAALTLMEAETLFSQVLMRWPNLIKSRTSPQWIDKPAYRGMKELLLRSNQRETSQMKTEGRNDDADQLNTDQN